MLRFARYMASNFGGKLLELIYTPLGFSIKHGRKTAPFAQADHYDHVHVAMRRGGSVPGQGNGDKIPALLEPGEHVIRKTIVEKYGPTFFAALNSGDVPTFMSGGQVAKVARGAGFKGSSLVTALAVARGESGWNEGAVNRSNSDGSIDRGLWQINSIHGSKSTLDPAANARAAFSISKAGRDWSPWVVFQKGLHRRHIGIARKFASASRGGSGGSSGGGGGGETGVRKVSGTTSYGSVRSGPEIFGQQLADNDVAAALAGGTAGTGDDIAALARIVHETAAAPMIGAA